MNEESLLEDETLMHAHVEPDELPQKYVKSTPYEYQLRGIAWMGIRERCPLRSCYGGMVLDEPGLGKTFMFYGHMLRAALPTEPTLVVVPAHLANVWEAEHAKHFTELGQSRLPLFNLYGRKKSTHSITDIIAECPNAVVIISYGVLANVYRQPDKNPNYQAIYDICWGRIVLDEAHNIRNCKTHQSNAVRSLNGRRKWAITATPIYNTLDDLFALVNFLGVRPFGMRNGKRLWNSFIRKQSFHNMVPLRNLLIDLCIRRNKTLLDLPDPTMTIRTIPMCTWQRQFYDALYEYCKHRAELLLGRVHKLERLRLNLNSDEAISGAEAAMQASHCLSCALTQILRLKQAACCPRLVFRNLKRLSRAFGAAALNRADPQTIQSVIRRLQELKESPQNECPICFDDDATHVGLPCRHACCEGCWQIIRNQTSKCPLCRAQVVGIQELHTELSCLVGADPDASPAPVVQSAKVEFLTNYVEKILMEHDENKIVIASQWAGFLEIILAALQSRFPSSANWFQMMTGRQVISARTKIIDRFQNNPSSRVLLLTLGAGGEGITLTAGTHMVLTDRWWNAAREYQTENRIHRIGQNREVHITLLECENSIEQVITKIVDHKQLISAALVGNNQKTLDAQTWLRRITCCLSMQDMPDESE